MALSNQGSSEGVFRSKQSPILQNITLSPGGPGSYGEGNAFYAREALLKLREALDNGEITVGEYLQQAEPVAQFINDEYFRLGGGGKASANVANSLGTDDLFRKAGFARPGHDPRKVEHSLGQQLEEEARRATLPSNLDPESKEKIITEIPTDIPLTSDRGQIEREALRQEGQAKKATQELDEIRKKAVDEYKLSQAGQRGTIEEEGRRQAGQLREQATTNEGKRKQAVSELATLLAGEQQRQFEKSIPSIAEQANLAGIYRSTGFGNALARENADLSAKREFELSRRALEDRELNLADYNRGTERELDYQGRGLERGVDIESDAATRQIGNRYQYANEMGDILDQRLGAQSAGLQREFSLNDLALNRNYAESIARASQPEQKGKTRGEKALGIAQGIGGVGTAVGSSKSGKKG